MIIELKYPHFKIFGRQLTGKKTPNYEIFNIRSGDLLGSIKWYYNWRKFVFMPMGNSVWDDKCLADITDAIKKITTDAFIKCLIQYPP